ncbi:hypothetical protein PR003_g30341 [Phytophthora rubi]|uniref:Reverse transcriptase domain-containing protein n=1 Tax=Phytophthora rubi TaxID=129364 RepID=A0A6A4BG21_9STRA|nr:hypothetical protein PR001_g29099 [Phytophthora rubi]KAE9271998.1 hypothetical protein PR003_g30341 [Phytophthora rubi]
MAGGGTTVQEAQCELERVFKAEYVDFVADYVPRLRAELLNDIRHRLVAHPELNELSPKTDLATADIGEPGETIPDMVAQARTVLERHHSSFQGDGNAVPGPSRAKRPPRKNGDELSGGDPRASAYLMNTLPQGLLEGALGRVDHGEAVQSRRSISRTSLASRDATSKLARPDRAEGEAEIAKGEIAKGEPENDPASDESEPEVVSRVMIGEGTTTHGAQKEVAKVFKAQPVDFVAETVSQLKEPLARCMRVEIDFSDGAEVIVYFHEDIELLKGLRNESAALPELTDLSPKADLTTTDIGEPGVMTGAMGVQSRAILANYHDSFLGDGNVVPGPARGVICDLNVNDDNGVAQRSRPIRPELLRKVYDLLEQRLQTELIEYSHSEWASPIVIVRMEIGVDIGICIGHRIVSQLTKLLHYRQPLIDDLLIGFKNVMGVLSLGMAKRFWTVPMTLRAKHISAFICLLGYFQRKGRLLGLKKPPLIYWRMLGDCLWGFVCVPASEEAQVDVNGLAFLGINVGDSAQADTLIEGMAGFQRNIPASP